VSILVDTDYRYQYADDGVLMNADTSGSFVDIDSVDGLDEPDIQTNMQNYDNDHGSFLDARWLQGRVITLKGSYYTSNETDLDQIKYNFRPRVLPEPFYFQHEGMEEPRVIFAKPSSPFRYTTDVMRAMGVVPFQVSLMAEDPTIYSATETSVGPVGMFSAGVGAGRVYPRTYPMRYVPGSTGTTVWPATDVWPADDTWAADAGLPVIRQSAVIVNKGTWPTGPKLTLYGPIANPVVTVRQTGQFIKIGVTLLTGDVLTLDMRTKSVLLNGVTRRNKVTNDSAWWLLGNGTWTIDYRGDVFQTDARMNVSYRSAWI
jgi:hypothetical protein